MTRTMVLEVSLSMIERVVSSDLGSVILYCRFSSKLFDL